MPVSNVSVLEGVDLIYLRESQEEENYSTVKIHQHSLN